MAVSSRASFLVLTDANGKSQTLLFTADSTHINLDEFEIPPSPPAGIFDVRYETQRILEIADKEKTKNTPILVSSVAYP